MRIESYDDVTVLVLEGGRANAMNSLFLRRLNALLDVTHPKSGAIVITGYERFFSGGLDLPTLLTLDREGMAHFIELFDDTMLRIFSLERPVVAAINGHAIAGGCVLALQADYRVLASGSAKMGLNEVQLGIGLPAPVVETLRCQVPASSLLPIAFEGRLFTPEEALGIGLIHEVLAPEAVLPAAIAKARALGALPAEAFARIKQAVRGPAIEAAHKGSENDIAAWVETWFSAPAQERLHAVAAKLGARPA